jgi:chromosome partitioning protein
MQTLTVVSRKGGSGKTTVSVSLALAARQAGLKVGLVDLDPLQSSAQVIRGRSDAASLLFESSASKLFVLQHACRQDGCDLLVVDTPTAPEAEIVRAIHLSDLCLAVARPTALDVAAVLQSTALIARVGRPGLVVLNQCPAARAGRESALVRQAQERLRFAAAPMARTRLRSRAAYQLAANFNQAVTEWSPRSPAAADVWELLAELGDHLELPPARPAAPPHQASPASPVRNLQNRVKAFAGA